MNQSWEFVLCIPCVAAICAVETGTHSNRFTIVSSTSGTRWPSEAYSIADGLSTISVHTPAVARGAMTLHLREPPILLTGWCKCSDQGSMLNLPCHAATDGLDGHALCAGCGATACGTAELSSRTLPGLTAPCVTDGWKVAGVGALERNVQRLEILHTIQTTTAVVGIRVVRAVQDTVTHVTTGDALTISTSKFTSLCKYMWWSERSHDNCTVLTHLGS